MNLRNWVSICGVLLFLAGGAAAQDSGAAKLSVWLPEQTWALEFDVPGFVISKNEIQPGGRRYFMATNPVSNVVVSVYLERAGKTPTIEECQEGLKQRAKGPSPFNRRKIGFREAGPLQIMEYSVLEVEGFPVNQRNLFACTMKDNVFVDIHLSKAPFKAADQPLFDAVLQSIHFVSRQANAESAPEGNSLDYWREGSAFFRARQYSQAIGPYSKALAIEKVTPTLDKNLWRVLIDNLGMAYGITLDFEHAKATFDYGVEKDPTYPMFYFNLACLAAEKDDPETAKGNLTLAFKYRANMIPGETLPDPRTDDSFQILLNKKNDFRQFVESLFGPAR
jgi:hypothetical protein